MILKAQPIWSLLLLSATLASAQTPIAGTKECEGGFDTTFEPSLAARSLEPIAAPEDPSAIQQEIAELAAKGAEISRSGSFTVYVASASQVPVILREIGRLREVTFRGVGEGSGKSRDLDRFDSHYLHLFSWDENRKQIVGAYRLAKVDEVISRHGVTGLLTTELFEYERLLQTRFQNAIELGRSFVVMEYQGHPNSLASLWKGIAQFVARNPRYTDLIGAVSISNALQELSKHLIVEFLSRDFASDLQEGAEARAIGRVAPKFQSGLSAAEISSILSKHPTLESLSEHISEIEPSGERIPVLIKLYKNLGARFLAFHFAQRFWSIDGLIHVDLTRTDSPLLTRLMKAK